MLMLLAQEGSSVAYETWIAFGAILGVVLVAIKFGDRLWKGKGCAYDGKCRQRDDYLAEQHNRRDQDGVELWYTPRSMLEMQNETAKTLQDVASTMKEMRREMREQSERSEKERATLSQQVGKTLTLTRQVAGNLQNG